MHEVKLTQTPHLEPEEAPQLLHLLSRSLVSMRAYYDAKTSLARGHLTRREREEIAIAVGEINGATMCVDRHVALAKKAGLDDKDVILARKAKSEDPKSNALLGFTLKVVLQRGQVKKEDLDEVKQSGFSDSEIIEILGNIAVNIFTNYINLISKTEEPAFTHAAAVK